MPYIFCYICPRRLCRPGHTRNFLCRFPFLCKHGTVCWCNVVIEILSLFRKCFATIGFKFASQIFVYFGTSVLTSISSRIPMLLYVLWPKILNGLQHNARIQAVKICRSVRGRFSRILQPRYRCKNM